jgi:hypothetical protein
MRFLIALPLLALLAACSKDKKTSTCTYNGVAVDCNTMRPAANPGNVGDDVRVRTLVVLEARAESPITVNADNYSFDVLENATDEVVRERDGRPISCNASLVAGDSFSYNILPNVLILKNGSEELTLTRVDGSGDLNGTYATQVDGGEIRFQFTGHTGLRLTRICRFF